MKFNFQEQELSSTLQTTKKAKRTKLGPETVVATTKYRNREAVQ